MNHFKGKCNKCGICCKAISLSKSTSDWILKWRKWLKENSIDSYIKDGNKLTESDKEGIFVAENWIKITKKEALKTNKAFSEDRGGSFFTCTALKNNQCSKYKERPYICSGYPNYSRLKSETPIKLINKIDCGFILNKL